MKLRWVLPILIFALGCSEKKEDTAPVKEHLLIGHTRKDLPEENGVIDEVLNMDISDYSTIVFTGDMAFFTTADSIMEQLDRKFDLSSKNLFWAPGNHDHHNLEVLKSYTGKTYPIIRYSDGTTWIITDSEVGNGSYKEERLSRIIYSIDTAEISNNIVFASHNLIWLQDDGPFEAEADSIMNGYVGKCSYCLWDNNFYEDIYPLLKEKAEDGKTVICVAGDMGLKRSKFEHITDDGVVFLASGMNEKEGGTYIVLEQFKLNGKMTWRFERIK